MIRITVLPQHPLTLVATDGQGYYFAQLISASRNILLLRMRKTVPSVALLPIRSVIVEALGPVTVEIGCRNISTGQDRLMQLEFQDPSSLEIQITSNGENNQ